MKIIENQWFQSNNIFKLQSNSSAPLNSLPFGIYTVNFSDREGFFLEKTQDKFQLPTKIYNVCGDLLNKIKIVFDTYDSNLGVLFSGLKGSGKSMGAKMLCNDLKIPVILIKNMGNLNGIMFEWLSTFAFKCCFFFDEFEKHFSKREDSYPVLSFLDGVYQNSHKKLYLLTVNSLNIDENLLSRPSRIRYVKKFDNLPKNSIIEYLTDNLKDTSIIPNLMSYIETFEMVSIDILHVLVQEINLFGFEQFMDDKEILNIEEQKIKYSCKFLCPSMGLDPEEAIKYADLKENEQKLEIPDDYRTSDCTWNHHIFKFQKHVQYLQVGDKVDLFERRDYAVITDVFPDKNLIYCYFPEYSNNRYIIKFEYELKISTLKI